MYKNITFTNLATDFKLENPKPASSYIPSWYKDLESYTQNWGSEFNRPFGTIKKCMPVFDVISLGYIIVSTTDVYVSIKDNMSFYEWNGYKAIEFHPVIQAIGHPSFNGMPYPKWVNPWGIETPKGYSTLFVPPFHRESIFTILPGIVDTDKYNSPVNFPFTLNNPNFTGLIPKGTPIAQAIPFKRDFWKSLTGNEKNIKKAKYINTDLSLNFWNGYKNLFRSEKKYK